MATAALNQNISAASGIADILQMLVGKKGGIETTTTSGGVQTTQTGVNAADIMTQILGATGKYYGGPTLSDMAAGRKRAGIYGGSTGMTEQRFLTEAATNAAVAAAPINVTKSPIDVRITGKGMQAGMMSGGTLGLGALALLAGSKKGRKQVTDLYDEIFGGTSAADSFVENSFDSGAMGEILGTTAAASVADEMSAISTIDWTDAANFGASTADITDAASAADMLSGGAELISGFGDAADYASAIDAVDAVDGADMLAFAGDGADFADAAGGGTPFLSAGMNIMQGDVGGAAGNVGGAVLGNMILPGVGGAIGSFIGGQLFGDDGGCFITTATLRALGNTDDNAPQLQTLRHFRDTWLLANHPLDIEEYYRIAPQIVQSINAREDSTQIWRNLWRQYLSPALALIATGRNEEAYLQYREMVSVATNLSKD